MSKASLFAVVGDPIGHSRSPRIFNALFNAMNHDAAYVRLSAKSGQEAAEAVRAMNLAGFNITSPLKSGIMSFLDDIDPQALAIDAVNCVVSRAGLWKGYNTDSFGAGRALEAGGIVLKKKRIAILGAGGAARAAAYGLIKSGASRVVLMNRTAAKAESASRRLGCEHAPLEKADEIVGQSDILISCLSASETPIAPKSLRLDLVVMDADYRRSPLSRMALEKGCVVIDGLDWLFYQAVLSFRLFTGLEVPPELQEKVKAVLSQAGTSTKPNLALVGFMGSGKTTLGKLLAEKTGFEFVDTDHLIEESLGMTVSEIFKKRGEAFFRETEKSLIRTRLPVSRRTVFSLGGGAILDEANRSIIGRCCRVIWLWVSPGTALNRIHSFSRPLLDPGDIRRKAGAILNSRLSLYAGVSDLVFNTEAGTPEELVRRIQHEQKMD
jgi:shikimate dehydrogenase